MELSAKTRRFEEVVLPHTDAAYNLARWLTHNEQDARDAVQEAAMRALRFIETFHGGDGRAWFLAIVRNVCHSLLERRISRGTPAGFDEAVHGNAARVDDSSGPLETMVHAEDVQALRAAIAALPVEFREVLVMREMEGMAYKEIAGVTELPIGTVMSRLSRARQRLAEALAPAAQGGRRVELPGAGAGPVPGALDGRTE